MNIIQRSGLLIIGATIVLDQATKYWALEQLTPPNMINVFPFMDFILAGNEGISFWFLGGGVVPPSAFILIAVLISAFLVWQLWNSTSLVVGLAFGLIIGGAIGNVIDRAIYGAVVDFILLSWKTWSWPVFNIADTAITCGVVLILIDSLWPDRRSTK
jgi:signal peptidase II